MNGGGAVDTVDSVQERVREILAIELQVERESVVPQARLRSDLGMDSVAALNVLFAAQETFGVDEIDPMELADVSTVADVEALVRRHLESARA
jgi:acyl carrier protein